MASTSNDASIGGDESKSKYDIILFGVTGFTGKLCCEYLLAHASYNVSWAACARNTEKAQSVIKDIVVGLGNDVSKSSPPLLKADLICETSEQEETLRSIVKQTRVVLTCAGPFEKYGQTLVKLCAEEGVGYADITGETDFFRKMIEQHDAKARETGAIILCHCGNDCIPQDLLVYEMHRFAKNSNAELVEVKTFPEFSDNSEMSGGTATTALYQLSKDRSNRKRNEDAFDPLLTTPEGTKSEYSTKNISYKSITKDPDLGRKVGPWIMGPVMVNCVRRSNSLLQYSKEFKYGDSKIENSSWSSWIKYNTTAAAMGLAMLIPALSQYLLIQPGEGPDRQTMESGFMTLYARGVITTEDEKTKIINGKFHFNKDLGYLYTAALLVETGMVLVNKINDNIEGKENVGGIVTPASALGHDLTQRILDHMDTSLEIKEEKIKE